MKSRSVCQAYRILIAPITRMPTTHIERTLTLYRGTANDVAYEDVTCEAARRMEACIANAGHNPKAPTTTYGDLLQFARQNRAREEEKFVCLANGVLETPRTL